ncbi:DUF3047 domain-containing protein [Sandarakinorhabdus oryzae]|uniref:DUF3047 domain-containing protein n=1 Tax=Sandarakinorhabdus oryzae TaxID=2675220 RepID=UPI0012E24287|nr:DUF3047 domain-containing protein [Sandarakinorhabdus oryzae]
MPFPLLAAAVIVGQFTAEGPVPMPWQVTPVSKKVPLTQYRVVRIDGVTGVEGSANQSMALLGRAIAVDLAATPILCWRWRIEAPVAGADMMTKQGDDYAARVYVGFDIPDRQLGLGTKFKLSLARRLFSGPIPDAALNYVWDANHPVGTSVPNAYTDRAQMVVMQSGTANAGRWVEQRVNLARDFARAFRGVTGAATLIAVAVDTDQTKGMARGWFADLHFVAADQACRFPG